MRMAASDRGRINKDFGYLEMIPLNYTDEDLKREPHLKVMEGQISEPHPLYGTRLYKENNTCT